MNQNIVYTESGSWSQTGVGGGGTPRPINNSGTRISKRFSLKSTGAVTPNYATALSLRPLPYSYERVEDNSEQGVQITRSSPATKPGSYGYTYVTHEGVLSDTPLWYTGTDNTAYQRDYLGGSLLSTLDAQARNSLLQKVRGTQINVAVATAEAGRTMKMVGDAALGIYGAYRELRRGNFVAAAGKLGIPAPKRGNTRFQKAYNNASYPEAVADAVAGGWLALQYGWKPLLQDIHGAIQELNDIGINQGLLIQSVARKSRTVPYFFLKPASSSSGITISQEGSAVLSVKYGVKYIRSLGAPQDLPRLGITNPAEVAWELVPFSFVVDWFLPVGQFLGSLDATLGANFHSGYKSEFVEGKYHQIRSFSNQYYPYLGIAASSRSTVRFKRIVLTDFPSPALPRFKNPASLLHMSNAVALLTKLLRK